MFPIFSLASVLIISRFCLTLLESFLFYPATYGLPLVSLFNSSRTTFDEHLDSPKLPFGKSFVLRKISLEGAFRWVLSVAKNEFWFRIIL